MARSLRITSPLRQLVGPHSYVRTFTVMALMCASPLLSTASAQADPICAFDGRLIASVEADGLHLQIQLDENPWSPNQWTTTPAGIDVYRSDIGVQCGAWERITEDPVAWNWVEGGGSQMAFVLVDDTAESGRGYMYEARAVDANRNPIPENANAYLGPATHGVALLGHGTLYGGPGGCGQNYRQEVYNCNQECFPWLLVGLAPEVEPYLNSDTTVLLYGEITGVTSFCGQNETIAFISSAVPSGCVVSVETTTWGNIKQLYR